MPGNLFSSFRKLRSDFVVLCTENAPSKHPSLITTRAWCRSHECTGNIRILCSSSTRAEKRDNDRQTTINHKVASVESAFQTAEQIIVRQISANPDMLTVPQNTHSINENVGLTKIFNDTDDVHAADREAKNIGGRIASHTRSAVHGRKPQIR